MILGKTRVGGDGNTDIAVRTNFTLVVSILGMSFSCLELADGARFMALLELQCEGTEWDGKSRRGEEGQGRFVGEAGNLILEGGKAGSSDSFCSS